LRSAAASAHARWTCRISTVDAVRCGLVSARRTLTAPRARVRRTRPAGHPRLGEDGVGGGPEAPAGPGGRLRGIAQPAQSAVHEDKGGGHRPARRQRPSHTFRAARPSSRKSCCLGVDLRPTRGAEVRGHLAAARLASLPRPSLLVCPFLTQWSESGWACVMAYGPVGLVGMRRSVWPCRTVLAGLWHQVEMLRVSESTRLVDSARAESSSVRVSRAMTSTSCASSVSSRPAAFAFAARSA
jgi:hypothetical protein